MGYKTISFLTVALLAGSSLSCERRLECGEGTIEIAGVCVIDSTICADECPCGEGLHADSTGVCVPDADPVLCDPSSTTQVAGNDGVITCVGNGDPGPCRLLCPYPSAGKTTICGQLVDFASDRQVQADEPSGLLCDPAGGNPGTPPCALKVSFHDALGLAQNPTTAPLPVDSLTINDCGQFAAVDVTPPSLGFVAVVVDDARGSDDDVWARSAVAFPVAPGDRRTDQPAYAVARSTDQQWTSTAVDAFEGATFADQGVVALLYLSVSGPVAGVQVTTGPDQVDPDHDYYFSDTDPHTRSTIDPALDATGPNGAALLVGAPLIDHSGAGGLPADCEWPPVLAKSVPGLVWITVRHAAASATGEPCPE